MISHGFISGAMFFSIGVLYDRMHSRKIDDYGVFVIKCQFFLHFCFFCVSELRIAATSGFVGDFL